MEYFGARPAFEASSINDLEGAVHKSLGADLVRAPTAPCDFVAQGHCRQLYATTLWHCSYQIPISLKLPESDNLRLQIPVQGSGTTRFNHNVVPVSENKACLSEGGAEIDFGPGYRQLVWLVRRGTLQDKFRAITGEDVATVASFAPEYDLSTPGGVGVRHLIEGLSRCLEIPQPSVAANLLIAELEQSLLTALLLSARHSRSHLLERVAPSVAPWQVRRAESYMEENWNRAITIEELSSVTGTSVRSLFRTFRQHRGYTPMAFLREIRLGHAKRILMGEEGESTSVTDVAFACGFSDPANFSRAFACAFGISPSSLLRGNSSKR